MKVLLIQYKMIGDVLTTSVVAQQIKMCYPDARVDYLIQKSAVAVVEQHPYIDSLLIAEPEEFKNLRRLYAFAKAVKKSSYDVVIDCYSKLGTAFISWKSGAPIRSSYKKWYSKIAYTHTYATSPKARSIAGTAVENRILLASPIIKNPQWDLRPHIYLTDEERQEGKSWLFEQGIAIERPLTMVAVLGSSPNKTLPYPYMAQVLNQIAGLDNQQILLNYLPHQKPEVDKILSFCSASTQKVIFNKAYMKGLREFLKVLSHCDALIGNEGGSVNMAKALNVPNFSIFSPWIPKASWNSFENNTSIVSVHLQEYIPEIYGNLPPKNFKDNAAALYQQWEPKLFSGALNRFLEENY